MAIRPKTPEQLRAEATFVYVGRVTAVREQEESWEIRGEADFDVEACEQALIGDGDQRVTLHYRLPDPQETGGEGQHSPPPQGERVRVFIRFDAENRAQLLEPNGWEPAG